MPHVTKLLFAAWAVSQAVFPAAAQSSGSSSYGQCSRGIQLIGYDRRIDFNSTGSMPFDIGDQDGWYLSYLLHDTRQEFVEWNGFPTAQFLESYISVPESFIGSTRGNETETCMYTTRGLNKTSEAEPGSDASESCKGVLSDDCIELLRRVEGPTDGNCPNITGIEDECGFSVAAGRYTFGRSMNFSDASCTLDELPHINLPEGYRSYDTQLGGIILPADNNLESFETYDLRVRQSVPFLITTRDSEGTHAEVLCMAPNNVTDGSREPEELEFESTSEAVMPDREIFLVLVTAGLVSLAVF